MIEPTFECAMCNRDLLSVPTTKFVLINNKTETICKFCNNKYIPDEIKSVNVMAKINDKNIIKEYDLILFLNNNFIEKDINDYMPYDDNKLTKYLKKLFGADKKDVCKFTLKINLVKKRCNKCELCDALLDYNESIYFKKIENKIIQICRRCSKT